jgi:SagB-type dehydrogenase family enzyme
MRTDATPLLWPLLDFCHDWRTADEIQRAVVPLLPATLVGDLVAAMVKATLLEASGRRRDPRESRMAEWAGWNPAAGFFHSASRFGEYGDPNVHEAHLQHKSKNTTMPVSVKPAPARRVRLPPPGDTAISDVLRDRRTWRQFGSRDVTKDQLATLLALTSGITHWLTVPGLGEVPLTTSPSGGSRHPIDTYVVVTQVDGVRPGVYRYVADRHELGVVRRGLGRKALREWLPQQPWWGDAPFVLFFTAVFGRTQWRYEFPRAYRAVLLEAGHMCQTFLLAATALGLAPFCTMAIDDERVEAALGVDGIGEAVLYAAGAGTRPRGVQTRVVMPRRTRKAAVRTNENG